jgi:ferredoxin
MKKPPVFVVFLGKVFPYSFVVAKMTKIPLLRNILGRILFHQTNLTYLLKDSVVEIQVEKHIQSPDNMVLPSQVVEHFIRIASHRFIMDFCICRQSMHCKNHPVELGCLFLGDAVKDIDPAYGKEVNLQEALAHVQKCRQAGLIHLIGRDHIDKTWLQVKSGEKLMTICSCCSCCCLWKWLPALDPGIRAKVKRMPGVTVSVTNDCAGCGTCVDQCFMHAIHLTNSKASISDECRGCGRCVDVCPQHAIQLHIDDPMFLEKTIERVASSVKIS